MQTPRYDFIDKLAQDLNIDKDTAHKVIEHFLNGDVDIKYKLELVRWLTKKEAGGGLTGWQAAERFREYDFKEYLDVGSGKKNVHHPLIGKKPITTDLFPPANYVGDYATLDFGRQFPAIWCNHVLEHQLDVQVFLRKLYLDLEIGGILCVTVPPAHPEFMGGHVSLWTEGLLIYRLILAGFDCKKARVGVYDRNISVIVEKKPIEEKFWPKLVFDLGDIEVLKDYFPVEVGQWGPMKFGNVRW